MKRAARALTAAMAVLLSGAAWPDVTQSIATNFVEVLVEGVPLASRYPIEGKLVDIVNKGETTLNMRLDALDPAPSEMRAGYEPIPEIAWVGFEPRTVTVGPGETKTVKAVLYIPEDPALVGHRFQVMLFIHSDASKGSMVSIGLKPRLLFSVAGKAEAAGTKLVNNPQFLARVIPFAMKAKAPEMVFDCGMLEAQNPWDEEMTYEFVRDPEAFKKAGVGEGETPFPDLSLIDVSPPVLILRPHTRAEMAVTARLPVSQEYFGRVYGAALRFSAKRAGAKTVEVFNKVHIVVPNPVAMSGTVTGAPRAK